MPKHLIAISVGPVQDFIASARRMGDLYAGSNILSKISRAVAQNIKEADGDLIFPYPEALTDETNVANIILAELPEQTNVKTVAAQARQTAAKAFSAMAGDAYSHLSKYLNADLWNSQKEDVVEFFAAWVPCTENYSEDRKRVMSLLAARKATREFSPAKGFAGVPKSSLDGLRESVFINNSCDCRELTLNGKEFLDCIGVVKRRQSNKDARYPSITTVAASNWLQNLKQCDPQGWTSLEKAHSQLQKCGAIPKVPARWNAAMKGWTFDASPLYEHRHPAILAEIPDDGDKEMVRCVLREISGIMRKSHAECGTPSPYYAYILADGDKMGATLNAMQSVAEHRTFSKQLATFASGVPQKLAQHGAFCIYSGGDDVMAFASVEKALDAAKVLHDEFSATMNPEDHAGQGLTLSVGIAIVHVLEPLSIVRNFAKVAEYLAKEVKHLNNEPGRNGLAIALHTRGTETADVCGQWNKQFAERMETWIALFKKKVLPSNLPYATARALEDFGDIESDKPSEWGTAEKIKNALPARLMQIWKHKQINVNGEMFMGNPLNCELLSIDSWEKMKGLFAELRVARFLAIGDDQ